jgi:hypothetical protein
MKTLLKLNQKEMGSMLRQDVFKKKKPPVLFSGFSKIGS